MLTNEVNSKTDQPIKAHSAKRDTQELSSENINLGKNIQKKRRNGLSFVEINQNKQIFFLYMSVPAHNQSGFESMERGAVFVLWEIVFE